MGHTLMPRTVVIVAAAFLLIGCAAPPAPRATPDPAAAGLIVEVSGDTALKRQNWQDYRPATFGSAVRRGDLIRATGASRAVIACPNFNLAELSGKVEGYPCADGANSPIVFEGALVSPTRGDQGTGEYPAVVSPRKTRLLHDRPLLQWTATPGATSYKVSIEGTAWQTEVSGATELAYPADAPALEPGKSYRLVVEADGRSSSEEAGPGLGFSMLSATEAQQVRADEARARGLSLSAQGTQLLVSNLYAAHQLYAEALLGLTSAPGTSSPALTRLEGDLAVTVGLLREAEAAYAQAFKDSTAAHDDEGQALASRGLGIVYKLLGNSQEAARYYGQARRLYEELGDRQAVGEIDAASK